MNSESSELRRSLLISIDKERNIKTSNHIDKRINLSMNSMILGLVILKRYLKILIKIHTTAAF